MSAIRLGARRRGLKDRSPLTSEPHKPRAHGGPYLRRTSLEGRDLAPGDVLDRCLAAAHRAVGELAELYHSAILHITCPSCDGKRAAGGTANTRRALSKPVRSAATAPSWTRGTRPDTPPA